MEFNRRWLVAGAIAVALGAIGTGTAVALSDDGDVPITGDALERATDAALAHTKGGTVTETEIEDDGEAYYEVEVELENGKEVEVSLDEQFNVIGDEVDDEDEDDDNEQDDRSGN